MTSHTTMRRQLRQQRKIIPSASRAIANHQRTTLAVALLRQHCIVASYLSLPAESCTKRLHQRLMQLGIRIYVPVIQSHYQLAFIRWRPFTGMQTGAYGITEPRYTATRAIDPRRIDAYIVPLLGFDARCERLGMGGGYYDRHLATQRQRSPLTVGLAFRQQQRERLAPAPWDQPLDYVVTATRLFQRRRRKR